ncbi:hypothetical protein KGA66_22985 [Actinocrinis puniceicyclus]|uniref:Uncharacterized protein n=1 Tax=Actinocrinis puniceicyclus TaxID=977794 RepID=A0A8J7WVH7_9ACTN|nr:hypothetical protein [Actinocrinis puniceicyclus]MBS2965929.1 hypothetical protein [Actinocrinis puniceicyclus]
MTDHPGTEPFPDDVVMTLTHLLRPDDPVQTALLAQIPHVTIKGRCGCGCATVYFDLDTGAVMPGPIDPARHPLVAEAGIVGPCGEPLGEVLVFARDGYLSWLEVCSWSDATIRTLPSPDRLEPYGRTRVNPDIDAVQGTSAIRADDFGT